MKRKIRKLKKLMLTVSSSSVLTWIWAIVVVVGMLLDAYSVWFYKVLVILFIIELLFVNANNFNKRN